MGVGAFPLLNSVIKRIARPFVQAFGVPLAMGVRTVLRFTGRRVGIALVYHSVAEASGDRSREIVAPHGVRLVERQIRHLAAHYRVVDARDLLGATAARRRGQRFPAAITFDDDLACHAEVSLPVVTTVGVPATFFLSGASLSTPFAFWWERLQRAFDAGVADVPALVGAGGPEATIHELGQAIEAVAPAERALLSARLAARIGPDPSDAGIREEQVRRLVDAGMTVGFHTLRHDPLPPLDDAALAAAMHDGREGLEGIVGQPIDVIGYPHGRAEERVAAAAQAAGFTTGFTVTGEPVRVDSHPLLLSRIVPTYRSLGHFAVQLVLELLAPQR